MDNKERFDCVIIGSGLSGLTTALALSKIGLRVALADKDAIDSETEKKGDQRTTAVSSSGKNLFEALGIWKTVEGQAEAILDIRVSEKNNKGFLNFDHREVGSDPMGHIVDNVKLKNSLLSSIKLSQTIALLSKNPLTHFSSNESAITVHLEKGQIISAPLLIAADGRFSRARDIANIKTTRINYNQIAMVFKIAHTLPHHGVAYERFLPGGPIAFLPMNGNHSSVVWSENTETAKELMELNDTEFSDAVSYRIDDCMGKLKIIGNRRVFPLSLIHAESLISERFAMVGDAAHGLHPIAGQGFNLGLRDIANLVEEIARGKRLGLDIGSFEVLRSYESSRYLDNMSLVFATDSLTRLFSNNNDLIKGLRRAGLGAVNEIRPLKQKFMKYAMGTLGDIPSLLEGRLP
jgi:2-octaprenyl-6-methoxyphenol hydroxylase